MRSSSTAVVQCIKVNVHVLSSQSPVCDKSETNPGSSLVLLAPIDDYIVGW